MHPVSPFSQLEKFSKTCGLPVKCLSLYVCGDCLALTRRKREQACSWKAEGAALGKYSLAVAAGNERGRSWVNWKPAGHACVLAREAMPWRGNRFLGCIVLLKEMSKRSKQYTFGQGVSLRAFSRREREHIHSKTMPKNTSTDFKLSSRAVSSIVFHSSTLWEIMKISKGDRHMSEQYW